MLGGEIVTKKGMDAALELLTGAEGYKTDGA